MMETCPNGSADRREREEADELKGNFSSEFTFLPNPQQSVLDEREHLQVYLRIRPFTSAECNSRESQDCVSIESLDTVLLKPPGVSLSGRLSVDRSLPQTGQRFQFSQVFGAETTQRELFQGTVKDLVKDVLHGGNSLVFTYGVTNAGKTFTFLGPAADVGILPRSLDLIFNSVGERVFTGTDIKPQRCRDFSRLCSEQQMEEANFKRDLFRQLKESERSNVSLVNSTNKTLLEGASMLGTSAAAEDKISLEVAPHTKFSIWVSFCEIYNENIHDLLEVLPSSATKRTVLRLSQDVKGNAFVKDLRWVQVTSTEEAFKVMKFGKKNQSFSSTRLNQVSSRSHSIFSVRVLKMEDVGTLRVHAVSELCLCDLAGSERCAKTQNKGERLKEAGNINTSLLILGKCINTLRHNQQAKLLQHVPFRESKLTHYLQSFLCGRGKACMIVNINQCASMYDETLNVLKFSAVAQKVVVLTTKTLPIKPLRSATEVSTSHGSRRSSLNGWETSLEDVQEDMGDECDEDSLTETTVDPSVDPSGNEEESREKDEKIVISEAAHRRQGALLLQLQLQLKKERAEGLLLEARVREEISREFSELFSDMQKDYNERLAREREILEERAERRLEIFKNLIGNMTKAGSSHNANEVLSALEKERKAREDVLAALEFQTLGKEEALALMEEERKAKEEALETITELRRDREEATNNREKARSVLERAIKISGLMEETEKQQQQVDTLQQEVKEMTTKLDLSEQKVANEGERASKGSLQLQSAQAQLDDRLKEIQNSQKNSQLHSLKQELQVSTALSSSDELKQNVSALERSLADEKENSESRRLQMLELERELAQTKEQVEKVNEKQEASNLHLFELRTKLQEREEIICMLEERERDAQEQTDELKKKLQEQQESQKLLTELKYKLKLQQETSDKVVADLKQKFCEEEKTVELLRAELEEAQLRRSSSSSAAEELKRVNSELQAEVASLRSKVADVQEIKASEAQSRRAEEKLAESEKASVDLQNNLQEMEAQLASLQKSLKEAQERRDEEEIQVVQEARRREVERRRELLAVAHEAIAQKDEELEKRAEEVNRLKENAKQDSEKVMSLSVDLQRKEDEASDLREKLADYKKQVQQVQKEISVMREDEKLLRQKLSDAEKARKQLQCDVAGRDRTIQQLRAERSSDSRSDQTLHQKTCKDLEAKERVMEDMRLALTEQEETQAQMEEVLEEKLRLIQELSEEVEKLKASSWQQSGADGVQVDRWSHDLSLVKQEAAKTQEQLKLCTDKHQAERRKWLEEKLSLIGQAKEAEDKRNQEMRKFADDRERYTRQQSRLESELSEKEQMMETWRTDRDTLVSALEVQLHKLLSSQAQKDREIQELRRNATLSPKECDDGVDVVELQAALREREADVHRLKEELKKMTESWDKVTKVTTPDISESPAAVAGKPQSVTVTRKSAERRKTRASVSSQSSSGFPSVLESSEISTENGRMSRFPRPELEISFSPLQPNRMALRRQGDNSAITVKITRSARKRKSGEMDKEEQEEAENRRNTRTKVTTKLTPHKEETSSAACRHDSRSSKKEGTLQKIGDFLQSSPTLLGTKAKKMVSLMSGRSETESSSSSSSLSLRAKKNKRRLFRPEISSPMDLPSHTIISVDPEESEREIMKRRLRSRMIK